MKRNHFLLLAGLLSLFFGISMIVTPGQMLANMTTIAAGGASNAMRWLGASLVAIGAINLFARNDPGSEALRAVMTGNIVLHVIAWGLDFLDYLNGIVRPSGIVTGSIVHLLLTVGFVYYLGRMGRQSQASGTP